MSKVRAAHSVCARARAAEKASLLLKQRRFHILEDVTLSDDHAARAAVEGVPTVGVEVVVYGVDEGVSTQFGGATGGVVDVVAL